MIKFLFTLKAIFLASVIFCQQKIDTTLTINEIGRNGKEANFLIRKGRYEYSLKFVNSGTYEDDSLYVFYGSRHKCLLKAKIEMLDTLELDSVTYEGESAILIKTGGNILVNHVLKLRRQRSKLLQRVSL